MRGHAVWVIARQEAASMVRSWRSLVLLALLPAILMYVVGLGAQGFTRSIMQPVRLAVIDEDESPLARDLAAALRADASIAVCSVVCATPPAATLTIPAGTGDALLQGRQAALPLVASSSSGAAEAAQMAVLRAMTPLGAPYTAARFAVELAGVLGVAGDEAGPASRLEAARLAWQSTAATSPVVVAFAGEDKRRIRGPQLLANGFKLSMPAVTVMFVMLGVLGLTHSLAQERALGITRRTLAAVGARQYLAGKLAAAGLVGFVQFALLLAFGILLDVDVGGALGLALLVGAAYVASIAGLAAALSTVVATPQAASGALALAWIVLAPLGGAWWPLTFVPPWLEAAGHLSPVAWCIDALNALIYHQGTLSDVIGPVAVLGLFALLFCAVALRRSWE